MQFRYPLIAFTGYARSGKDESAKVLIEAGYHRTAFGDIIKRHLDPIIQKYFGFSAFTEVSAEKARIRRTLESYGEDAYDLIFTEFFDNLAPVSVNPRLCRLKEATEWVRRGGIIVNITRPGSFAETPWSAEVNCTLRDSGLIHSSLLNDGTVEELQAKIRGAFL